LILPFFPSLHPPPPPLLHKQLSFNIRLRSSLFSHRLLPFCTSSCINIRLPSLFSRFLCSSVLNSCAFSLHAFDTSLAHSFSFCSFCFSLIFFCRSFSTADAKNRGCTQTQKPERCRCGLEETQGQSTFGGCSERLLRIYAGNDGSSRRFMGTSVRTIISGVERLIAPALWEGAIG
jgi:hypothetical protein